MENKIKLSGKSIPPVGESCYRCNKYIFAVTFLFHTDFMMCPLCGAFDYFEEEKNLYRCDMPSNFVPYRDKIPSVCCDCLILYSSCCTHGKNEYGDYVNYGLLVNKFKIDNDPWVHGMPVFESVEQIKKIYHRLTIDWICMSPGTNSLCAHSIYPNFNLNLYCKRNISERQLVQLKKNAIIKSIAKNNLCCDDVCQIIIAMVFPDYHSLSK